MSDNLKVTEGLSDAAYLINQVAEHCELSLADLDVYEADALANPWEGKSKETFIRTLSATRELHVQLSDISAAIIDATIKMMAEFDSTIQTIDQTANLSNLY
ncbi:MAG: hypothetical protein FWH40_06595 [Coriobacteriia bacterium]|nr:hypothetical protein [Coriobacteriia bacterium]